MRLRQLFEAKAKRTIAVMPGGFHPFHPGHKSLYDWASKTFGQANVYVAATNDTKARPFPFDVKQKLASMAGVPRDRFIQVKSPFNALSYADILGNPAETSLIFVRSEKDKTSHPLPDQVRKSDGMMGYLVSYTDSDLETADTHGYIAYGPTIDFNFSGIDINSASQLREKWPSMSDEEKSSAAEQMYPGNAEVAVNLLNSALGSETVEEGWFGFGDPELLPEPEWLDAENKQLWAQKQPNEDDDRFVAQLRIYTNMAKNHLIDDANMGLRFELESLKRNVTEASPTVPEKIVPFEVPEPPKAPDATIPRRRNGYSTNDGTTYIQDRYNENIMTVETDRGEFVFDGARLIKWTSPIPQYRQVHDFVRRTITVKTNTIADTGDGEVVIKQDSVYDLDGNLKDSGNINYSAGGISVTTGSKGTEIRYNMGPLEVRFKSNPRKARAMNVDPEDLKGIANEITPLFRAKEIVQAASRASKYADITLLWNGRAKHPREIETLMKQQDG